MTWAMENRVKDAKMICEELSETGSNILDYFFATWNNDFSTQDRCTEPKLAWLELSCREDSEYVKQLSAWFVNESAAQNIWQHQGLSEVGETVAHMCPQVVEIAAL